MDDEDEIDVRILPKRTGVLGYLIAPAQGIETAPSNTRVLIASNTEMAMAWKDAVDSTWWYAPQGGLVWWTPTVWMPVPAALLQDRDTRAA